MTRGVEGHGGISTDPAIVLAGPNQDAILHNFYVPKFGYIVNHIPAAQRRDLPNHWDTQFGDIEAFQTSWHPRPGPLELVYNLTLLRQQAGLKKPMTILNLGGGYGDFTVNLAQIPKTAVGHVDFSQSANKVASELVEKNHLTANTEIITSDNREYLRQLINLGQHVDMIFIYGGLAENTPLESDIEEILQLATLSLNPGGYLWYVGLEQPLLRDAEDRIATDILGEYPSKPGLIREIVLKTPSMYLVRDINGEIRPDNHPLVVGGTSEDHTHVVYRGLFIKENIDGSLPVTPDFGFKNAVNPNWPSVFEGFQTT